jgi:hypothetical protein
MSENVPFFEHMLLKLAKSANMTKNFFQNWYGISKNAEFYAGSKFVEMGF